MNNSIKRAQSQARLSFAERENFRPKVRQYKKLMMTLALLLTAVTGAWARGGVIMKELTVPSEWNNDETLLTVDEMTGFKDFSSLTNDEAKALLNSVPTGKVLIIYGAGASSNSFKAVLKDEPTADAVVDEMAFPHESLFRQKDDYKYYYTAEPPIEVIPVAEPAANTQQWTFSMPASDVVLTPIYSEATVRRTVGQTTSETAYETLKEAFANVQNGDVIKLDWDVTVSEPLTTPSRGDNDPISFTLDLNGYILDAETTVEHVIRLNNGDELTISNIRDDKLGGIKGNVIATDNSHIIFDGGRYLFSQSSTAEAIQQGWNDAEQYYGWQMAEGKEFVNVNNGSADNQGFLVRVDYAAFELTIGAGRFATFYDTHNITMIEQNQNISFYTIKRGDIDLDNNVAKVTKVENTIIPAGLPLLVYNGGQQQQTVKLKVTTTEATPIPNIAIEFVGTLRGREFYDEDMAAYDYYALSGGKMFVPVYETGSIAPHKCWIQFLKQQGGARSITIVFDDATAISTVSGSPADTGDIYDLQGRKVQKPARKGVFIQNGKKVVR